MRTEKLQSRCLLYYMWLLHVQVLWCVLVWCLLVSPSYPDWIQTICNHVLYDKLQSGASWSCLR